MTTTPTTTDRALVTASLAPAMRTLSVTAEPTPLPSRDQKCRGIRKWNGTPSEYTLVNSTPTTTPTTTTTA